MLKTFAKPPHLCFALQQMHKLPAIIADQQFGKPFMWFGFEPGEKTHGRGVVHSGHTMSIIVEPGTQGYSPTDRM
jgi:hypothetical protein